MSESVEQRCCLQWRSKRDEGGRRYEAPAATLVPSENNGDPAEGTCNNALQQM